MKRGTFRWAPAAYPVLGALIPILLFCGCDKKSESRSPSELLSSGWQYFRTTDFSQGTALFQTVIAQTSPGDPAQAEALFGLASTAELKRPNPDPAQAKKLYRQLLQENPESPYAPWAALALARMSAQPDYNSEPDRTAGVAAYQEVIDRYPGDLATQEALVRQQTLRITSNQPADLKAAIVSLQEFVRKNPDSPFASTAWWITGCAALGLNDYQLARDSYQKCYDSALARKVSVLRNMYSPIDEASTLYAIATLSEFKLGDLAAARKSCQRLIEDFPRDWRAFTCRQALQRMDALEAGGTPKIPGVTNPQPAS